MVMVTTCSTCQARFHSYDPEDTLCLTCLDKWDDAVWPLVASVRQEADAYAAKGYTWWTTVLVMPDDKLAELVGQARTPAGAVSRVWTRFVVHVKAHELSRDVELDAQRALWDLAQGVL